MGIAQVFVVRIYRQAGNEDGEFAGVVDVVAAGTRHTFRSLEELFAILRAEARSRREALLFVVPAKRK